MENKNDSSCLILKELISNPVDWYLLRYRLIKRIHRQEEIIRNSVIKNQQYFAYLLKIQFSDFELERLNENKILPKAVSLFRNSLISLLLRENIFEKLQNEINQSMLLLNLRKYSY
jgi:hypothetical protein